MPKEIDSGSFRVKPGREVNLKRLPTDIKASLDEAEYEAQRLLRVQRLAELQQRLYAEGRWALLLIFQGMDTSGKDGAIRNVLSGVNPAGVMVYSFKRPSSEELRHDWMWRTNCRLPEKGRIGIFNRSYYEEMTAVRVHPEFLDAQAIPEKFRGKKIWERRAAAIVHAERALNESGTKVVKFFLHVSKKEQAQRLLKRVEESRHLWKFDPNDLKERAHWKDYQRAWSDAISWTSAKEAPWYVIPADSKRRARIAIADIIIKELEALRPRWPVVSPGQTREVDAARRELRREAKD